MLMSMRLLSAPLRRVNSASLHQERQQSLGHKSNRPALTHMMHFKMSSSDKLKLPEIRFLTPQEDQQLTDLAEDIAQQMLVRIGKSARNNDAQRSVQKAFSNKHHRRNERDHRCGERHPA
jgi:hypothetical protein